MNSRLSSNFLKIYTCEGSNGKAGFSLHKWVTNNSELQKLIYYRKCSNPDETENIVLDDTYVKSQFSRL